MLSKKQQFQRCHNFTWSFSLDQSDAGDNGYNLIHNFKLWAHLCQKIAILVYIVVAKNTYMYRERIIKYLKLKLPNLIVKKFISIENDKNQNHIL